MNKTDVQMVVLYWVGVVDGFNSLGGVDKNQELCQGRLDVRQVVDIGRFGWPWKAKMVLNNRESVRLFVE